MDSDHVVGMTSKQRLKLIQKSTGSPWSPNMTILSHEEMVCKYVNTLHIPFPQALKLYMRDYNIKSKKVKHLDYREERSRVNHAKEATMQAAEKLASNYTAWQGKIRRENGLSSYDSLEDNLQKIKFITPIQYLVGVLSSAVKIQNTFDYSNIPKNEAFERLFDWVKGMSLN